MSQVRRNPADLISMPRLSESMSTGGLTSQYGQIGSDSDIGQSSPSEHRADIQAASCLLILPSCSPKSRVFQPRKDWMLSAACLPLPCHSVSMTRSIKFVPTSWAFQDRNILSRLGALSMFSIPALGQADVKCPWIAGARLRFKQIDMVFNTGTDRYPPTPDHRPASPFP